MFRAYLHLGRFQQAATQTTNIAHLSVARLKPIKFPLPPMQEQQRTVARVDELMGLLNQLEAARAAREDARRAARDAALAALRDAPDAEAVEVAWSRIAQTLDDLAGAPEGLQRLRELVLALAVRGKLVPQDPRDEPATALLERIVPGLEVGTGPYDVPTSWAWTRFDAVAKIASNLVDPAGFQEQPHVAPDSIEKGTGRLLGYRTIEEDGVTSGKHRFYPGQILYSKIRPNLSKVVIVDFGGLCSADMYPVNARIDRMYLHLYMLSSPFLAQVTADDNRLAMPKVNQSQLSAVAVPVPPLAEQQRIVGRVNELMGLLDRLEAAQTARDTLHMQFAAAAVYHLDL